MPFLQKQHIIVKLILFLIAVFIIGIILSSILGLIVVPAENEVIPDWVFSLSFILSFVFASVMFVGSEHNALHKLRAKAEAVGNDEKSIHYHADNLLLQLNLLLDKHIGHEADIYLHTGVEKTKDTMKKVGSSRTLEEVKHSIRQYPHLSTDEHMMKLFSETIQCYENLLQCKLAYNKTVTEYNAGINSFPAKLFRKMWKFEPLPYFNDLYKK